MRNEHCNMSVSICFSFAGIKVFIFVPNSMQRIPVADPGGSTNLWIWGLNLLIGKIFAENYMKIKEIEPTPGGTHP